jgi:hypothetical protein
MLASLQSEVQRQQTQLEQSQKQMAEQLSSILSRLEPKQENPANPSQGQGAEGQPEVEAPPKEAEPPAKRKAHRWI